MGGCLSKMYHAQDQIEAEDPTLATTLAAVEEDGVDRDKPEGPLEAPTSGDGADNHGGLSGRAGTVG